MDIRSSSLTGAAGEHLVMSRLLSRGCVAALAPQGVLNFDIVVMSPDGADLCAIQVKTRWDKGTDPGWHMQEKHKSIVGPRIFYAFVDLGKTASVHPIVWVIPSCVVAEVVRESYKVWLGCTGTSGQPHKETKLRRLAYDYSKMCGPSFAYAAGWINQYRERWDQIPGLVSFVDPASSGDTVF